MKTCKIVLTGGPCGGKTESIDYLSSRMGDSVLTVNESANSLLSLGYMPGENISTFDFQNLLFKIQFLKEYLKEGNAKYLLCDRGLLDGNVYLDDVSFNTILTLNGVDKKSILSTYDMALYFRSIAYELPLIFSTKRIYETPEVGISRDKRCVEIWNGKIVPCEYDNKRGLIHKQKSLYSSLRKQLILLEESNMFNLSDYYNNEYVRFMENGMEKIMSDNRVDDETKEMTRRLVS